MDLPETFVAERERWMVPRKSSFRQLQHGLAHSQRLGQALTHPQHLKLLAKDAPEFFLALHGYQPSLNWLTRRVARLSPASGKACSSSEVMSFPTKKLVVPITSLGNVSGLWVWASISV